MIKFKIDELPDEIKEFLTEQTNKDINEDRQFEVIRRITGIKKYFERQREQWENNEIIGDHSLISDIQKKIDWATELKKLFENEPILDKKSWYDVKSGTEIIDSLISYLQAFLEKLENAASEAAEKPQKKGNNTIEVDADNHIFMQTMKNYFPVAYTTIKKCFNNGLLEYQDGYFNFKCEKGCVGLIFFKAGYTEYKNINPHIKINGKSPSKSTLKNGIKNSPPKSWEKIKQDLFPNNPKTTPK